MEYKDFIGRELEEGDVVIYGYARGSGYGSRVKAPLKYGTIKRLTFTPSTGARAVISHPNNRSGSKQKNMHLPCNDLMKVDASMITESQDMGYKLGTWPEDRA